MPKATTTPATRGRKPGTVAVPVTVMIDYFGRVHGVPMTADMAVSLYRGADKAGKDAVRSNDEMRAHESKAIHDTVAAMSDSVLEEWRLQVTAEVNARAGA